MSLFVSLRTGIPVYSEMMNPGDVIDEMQNSGRLYPVPLTNGETPGKRNQSTIKHCLPSRVGQSRFTMRIGGEEVEVPISSSQLVEISGVPETDHTQIDAYLPFPYDPTGKTPLMIGDKIRTRFGTEGRVESFNMQSNGRVGVVMDTASGREDTETIWTDELDVEFRLEERLVVDWETYIAYLIWDRPGKKLTVRTPSPSKEMDVKTWIDDLAMPHPCSISPTYDHITEHHLRGIKIESQKGGHFSECHLKESVQNAVASALEWPPDVSGINSDSMMGPAGPDLWSHYAQQEMKHAVPPATDLYDTIRSEYSNTPLKRGAPKRNGFILRTPDQIKKMLDGEEAPRSEINAYGLDESQSEEEMFDEYLMDGL